MNPQKTMQAFVLTDHGGMDKLVWHDNWPTPEPDAHEVLIKVHACGLNNTDVNTRTGWYSKSVRGATTGGELQDAGDDDAAWGGKPLTFPRIQGADVVGTVTAVGARADKKLIKQRVLIDTWLRDWDDPHNMNKCGYFGSECDGGFAEFTKVDARHVHPIDSPLSDAELATFATSYVTAENMLERARVTKDDTVLITGASGGVGSALIQLANRRGAKTIAYCSEAKADTVREVGARHVLTRGGAPIGKALKAETGLTHVSVVADLIGGDEWQQMIECLARGGRYTCSGAIAGAEVAMDLRTFYLRDLTFTGATITPPDAFAKLVGYIERGEIRPLLAAQFPLRELHKAQQMFIDKKHVGNIVVCP